jgi:drug/metabolite transporter (DMT)-like permease
VADPPHPSHPSTIKVIVAFAAVYLIWGSTYLAIRFAIETIPPFLMAGVRFVLAGAVLYAWLRLRGAERPRRAYWVSTGVVGALLLLGGNGAVVWAETRVPSGITALLAATLPLWMVLLDWVRPRGTRPSGWVWAGIALGLAGIVLLVGPGNFGGGEPVDLLGAAALILGSLAWAAGSLYSRGAALPPSPFLVTAMQMLSGGALLILAGLATGELGSLSLPAISVKSMVAMLYLLIFGALVGFSCYIWLLRVSTPARVSTYAYVNPVVAVILGWAFAGEPFSVRTLLAMAVILGAVALITLGQREGPGAPRPREQDSASVRQTSVRQTSVRQTSVRQTSVRENKLVG